MGGRPLSCLKDPSGRREGEGDPSRATLPRRIHGLWLQGLDQAPALVLHNFERWACLNPGWRLQVLDRDGAEALLAGFGLPLAQMTPQAVSDVVRVGLLRLHGGVWVDASTHPSISLDAWLPPLVDRSGGFAFERPGPDRLISSWFLAAAPHDPLIAAWWREVVRFWSRPRRLIEGVPDDPLGSVSADGGGGDTYPYFWVHYLFETVVRSDPHLLARFESGAHQSAEPSRRLREAIEAGERDPGALRPLFAAAPVHKLDWRKNYPLDVLSRLAAMVGPAGLEPATRPL